MIKNYHPPKGGCLSMSYLLGYDLGSSSIKASLIEIESGNLVAAATAPETEMAIHSPHPGWAEQHPDDWWQNLKQATDLLKERAGINFHDIQAIGIAYQMHGLVLVDRNHQVLRPAIIWCDSRAVPIGSQAFEAIGPEKCLSRLLNSPGNFTASKLKWVQDNEPEIYQKIYKAMLPGEYIAMRLTGEIKTTPSGLSEGIWWDFKAECPADFLMEHYHINPELLPEIAPVFSIQGEVSPSVAAELGLRPGTKVSYRAGDQPNNAFSLNVLHPGEVAATAGTSGVVYGVGNQPNYDPQSRVNTFVHVNHTPADPRYGVLMCLNGTAILNRWIRDLLTEIPGAVISYRRLDELAATVPAGADGLLVFPYGNGAERTLANENIGASIRGLEFTRHRTAHLLRAAQEGIVFALKYGIDIMAGMGVQVRKVKAGHANMFLSPVFSGAFASVTGATVELYNTDGSQGAARGAGVGAGIYQNFTEAFSGLKVVQTIEPDPKTVPVYQETYQRWLELLKTKG